MVSQGRSGRVNQKARTRAQIVEAARGLSVSGEAPSIEQVADAAGVSRATAYRYFPTQEALATEISSEDVWSPVTNQLGAIVSDDVEASLARLIEAVGTVAANNETQIRTALKSYHDTWLRAGAGGVLPVRRGRRMGWIDQVLERLPPISEAKRERLRAALALAVGPDMFPMLHDVAGLDVGAATSVMRWAGVALLRAALAEPD